MEAISHVLEGMGSTPDQVAVSLRAASVQGLRDSTSFMNPVVRYLNRSLNIGGRLGVGAGGTMLRLLYEGQTPRGASTASGAGVPGRVPPGPLPGHGIDGPMSPIHPFVASLPIDALARRHAVPSDDLNVARLLPNRVPPLP